MSLPNEIDLARAAIRINKRKLDAAHSDYLRSIAHFEALLDAQNEVRLANDASKKTIREPKGRVRDLVGLAFTAGGLRRATFRDIFERIEKLAGHNLSKATVRQTLYRMEKNGELERYSGYWSTGEKLQNNP